MSILDRLLGGIFIGDTNEFTEYSNSYKRNDA